MRNIRLLGQLAGVLQLTLITGALSACKQQVGGDVMSTVDGRRIFRSDVDKVYNNNVTSAQQAAFEGRCFSTAAPVYDSFKARTIYQSLYSVPSGALPCDLL